MTRLSSDGLTIRSAIMPTSLTKIVSKRWMTVSTPCCLLRPASSYKPLKHRMQPTEPNFASDLMKQRYATVAVAGSRWGRDQTMTPAPYMRSPSGSVPPNVPPKLAPNKPRSQPRRRPSRSVHRAVSRNEPPAPVANPPDQDGHASGQPIVLCIGELRCRTL